jgi:hypothetical protein
MFKPNKKFEEELAIWNNVCCSRQGFHQICDSCVTHLKRTAASNPSYQKNKPNDNKAKRIQVDRQPSHAQTEARWLSNPIEDTVQYFLLPPPLCIYLFFFSFVYRIYLSFFAFHPYKHYRQRPFPPPYEYFFVGGWVRASISSVVDPKLFVSDPVTAFRNVADPDPDPIKNPPLKVTTLKKLLTYCRSLTIWSSYTYKTVFVTMAISDLDKNPAPPQKFRNWPKVPNPCGFGSTTLPNWTVCWPV